MNNRVNSRRAFFHTALGAASAAGAASAVASTQSAIERVDASCPNCLVLFPHPDDISEWSIATKLAEHDAHCVICHWRGRVRFYREAK